MKHLSHRVRPSALVQSFRLGASARESIEQVAGKLPDPMKDHVDDEIVGMAEVRRAIGRDWTNWGAARLMAGGSDIGWLAVLAAGHTFAAGNPGMGIDLYAFVTFASDDFINRDFGVTEEQSNNSGLAQTSIDGGYRSVGISAAGRWRFGENWQLQTEAGYEKYNSDIADSPIALNDYEAEIGISILYRF